MIRRGKVMADVVERQFIRLLQQTNFAFQLDEILTHETEALLMVYVQFINSTTDRCATNFCFRTFLA